MSHRITAYIRRNYIDQCRMLTKTSLKMVKGVTDACRDVKRNSSDVVDEDLRKSIQKMYEQCRETAEQIKSLDRSLGSTASEQDLMMARELRSTVNRLYLQVSAVSSAVARAALTTTAVSDAYDFDSVKDPELRTMMRLLARNKRYSGHSFDELKSLAKAKLDPSMKVSAGSYADTRTDIKTALAIDDSQIGMIPEASDEGYSPLEMMDKATQNMIDESLRKSAVKAIVESIRKKGFIVEKKNIRKKDDTVTIVALKPGNQKAEFTIDLDGKFMYCFDGYQGNACEQDITSMEEDLEKIYGISVTDKKVIWSNPDKLTKTQMQGRKEGRI